MIKRFCLRQDDDMHWYCMPHDKELLARFDKMLGLCAALTMTMTRILSSWS